MWQIVATLSMLMIEGSYLPQVYKLHKTKQAKDFNLMFPLFNAGGRLLAMGYTLSRGEWVLAIGFLFGLMIRFVLLGQVLYYQRREENAVLPNLLSKLRWTYWRTRLFHARRQMALRPLYKTTLQPAGGVCAPGMPSATICQPEACDEPIRQTREDGWWQRLCTVVEEQSLTVTKAAQQNEPSLRATMCKPQECGPNEHATIPLITEKRCRNSKH